MLVHTPVQKMGAMHQKLFANRYKSNEEEKKWVV